MLRFPNFGSRSEGRGHTELEFPFLKWLVRLESPSATKQRLCLPPCIACFSMGRHPREQPLPGLCSAWLILLSCSGHPGPQQDFHRLWGFFFSLMGPFLHKKIIKLTFLQLCRYEDEYYPGWNQYYTSIVIFIFLLILKVMKTTLWASKGIVGLRPSVPNG